MSPSNGAKEPHRRSLKKRLAFILPLLCLILFGTIVGARLISSGGSASASTQSLVALKGHVPGLVKTSTLVGATAANQSLSLSVGLQLRNASSLQNYVDSMTKHKSINAHRHLTSAEIAAAYAPLASSQQAVIDYLQGYGFKVTTTVKQHLVVGFQGTVSDAENAFHLTINNYRAPGGQSFYAPANDPAVPANLTGLIQSIAGLDNVENFTHALNIAKPTGQVATRKVINTSTNTTVYCANQYAGTPYLPANIATAYNLNGFYKAGFYGEGQQVALVEFTDINISDVSYFTLCYGGNKVPLYKVIIDGGNGGPSSNTIEADAEMEWLLSTAPHLAGFYVYEAPNSDQGALDMWANIIGNDSIPVVSTSWFTCELNVTPSVLQEENLLFSLAAAQGQTILAAAGNYGSNGCHYNVQNTFAKPSVVDPAAQPYVTGVGGTTLTTNSDYTYASEVVWENNGGGYNIQAGGGGISNVWPMPSWQQGPGVIESYSSGIPCAASSGYCREVPDISLNADVSTGYYTYCNVPNTSCNGYWGVAGGTEIATSIWAAFIALTNEKMLHDGGFNIGFVNPYLYQVDQNSTMYGTDFHDITIGNNDGLHSAFSAYPATSNYDMASGLGSFNAWNLAQDLEKLANAANGTRSAPANTTWYFAEGSVGGQFTQYLTLLNPNATQTAHVSVQYLFENQAAVTKTYTVAPSTRFTTTVNNDLGISASAAQQAISTIVTSDVAIVAERPLYFNRSSDLSSSGTDVLGATNATNTTFYFAAGDTDQTSSDSAREFITILNPNATAAKITATYYSGGSVVDTETLTVAPLHRGTIQTPYHGLAAIKVTSDVGVVIERPIYYHNISVPTAGGTVTGAASTVAATTPGTDWLFAEGHTADNFQENLVLANFGTSSTSATINLEYTNGSVQSVPVTVAAQSQLTFDVNNAYLHPIAGFSGTATADVSIEITSATPIVAERVMYFHYQGTISGVTDVVGEPGPSAHSVYSFAEGYTANGFQEWLTLQNPNASAETAAITLFFNGTIVEKEVVLLAHSRTTVNINDIVGPIASVYADPSGGDGYNVSIDVQAFGGTVVVERPLYFKFLGQSPGGTDVIGYTGG